jgi:diadenosine tetraphosphate (Ap4A) HIT family hydrolase
MNIENDNQCAHCPGGLGLKYPLYQNDLFWIVCDAHPLIEGHILIIPQEHVSCMGALADAEFNEYKRLYEKVKHFINQTYGSVGIFEHGIAGQTVFHAHAHFLPFDQNTADIIIDRNFLTPIIDLEAIKKEYTDKQQYLFFENKNQMCLVNMKLSQPRFFRDIFAKLLKAEERANWKKTEKDEKLLAEFQVDLKKLKEKWDNYNTNEI